MAFLLLALFATLSVLASSVTPASPEPPSQCTVDFMPWEIFFAGGSKTVVEDGDRKVYVNHYSVGDCPTFYFAPTGGNVGGRTAISYNITMSGDNSSCSVRTEGGISEFVSFQAIVIRTPGWTIQPRKFRLMDIDAHYSVNAAMNTSNSWREVAGVFGWRGSEVVAPEVLLNDTAVLDVGESVVPADAVAAMGLDTVNVTFPSVRFAMDTFHDCPWNNASRCEAYFDFARPIDTMVVLVSVTEKNLTEPFSLGGILLDKVTSECGCRCTLVDAGDRTIHVPVDGMPGQCERKITSNPYIKCDENGASWCDKRYVLGWTKTGEVLPNGYYPCNSTERIMARYLHPYDP